MKTCTRCHHSLPESAFNKSRRNKSGLRAECRQCQSDQSKGYAGPAKPKSQSKTKYLKMRVDGKNIPVHRFIASKLLGRSLLPGEVVHHINGDKHDNRPENLQVLTASDHSRMENTGKKLTEEHKAKVGKSLIGNQNRKGIQHSEEIKKQISSTMKKRRKNHPEWWSALFTKNQPK